MDYFTFIWSVVTFIEKRLKVGISYEELEKSTGFSYRHIRQTFKRCTKTSLAKYVLSRKISNAAFEIVHTSITIIDISSDYGFDSYDTFTRAFKRETGITPAAFRKNAYLVGRRAIASGVYAPAILKDNNKQLISKEIMEVNNIMKDSIKTHKSCILFGVPKVQYSYEECTPFPSCLKACLNYMGQNIDYAYLMAASGAAFRLRWNTQYWDGGNVDIMCIYEDKHEAFKRSFQASGRKFKILNRENSNKEGFISFIKNEINEGRPVIALGIIGPPEACIITGYDNDGQTLLGWNFFQNNPEFAKDLEVHETGYFICDNWWENPDTVGLMSIGEDLVQLVSDKALLLNAVDIMTKSKVSFTDKHNTNTQTYACGQEAYDTWAKAVADDTQFPKGAILPILFERIMCQGDAQTMVGEGRSHAACFVEAIGRSNENVSKECIMAANYFKAAAQATFKMNEIKGGFEQTETITRKFAEPEVRKKIVSLILDAKQHEAKACEILRTIIGKLE